MAVQILGQVECSACGTQANIKERGNSSKLYLHCPNCGLDQRSGKRQQDKLQAIIDSDGKSPAEQAAPTKQSEWTPQKAAEPAEDENPQAQRSGGGFKWFAASLLTVAAIAGTIISQGQK
jgi:predicted RNA-binding Zn-ribbon protein involved in translation (DUF1610 family)